jgi:hypothetical protein
MTVIELTHRKLLVTILGVAMIAAFGDSLAYAQTTQGQSLSQTSMIQGQGFQMNAGIMFSMSNGGIDPIGMCHGNMTYSYTPGSITTS